MNKIIKIEDFQKKEKNVLTAESGCGYAVCRDSNSKYNALTPAKDGVFLYPTKSGVRRISLKANKSACLYSRLKLPTPNGFRGSYSKGEYKMTKINNQEIRNQYKNELSTLQMLWKQYMEIKVNWYKGKYTFEQEEVFGAICTSLLNALIKLPIINPEDQKIKLELLQDLAACNVETFEGDYDLDKSAGFEEDSFQVINQLLAA